MNDIFERLSHSAFRSRFHLGAKEKEYVRQKGYETINEHTHDFIRKRLAPDLIPNDGKQTPMRGHPTFIAQHATATCCRSCLYKWHRIPMGRALTEEETEYICDVIMHYIKKEMN